MRRLSRCGDEHGDEHGAVIVLLAGFSVAMVALAALVVDVGAILDEKRQLQSGADSGALAVAYTCAVGPTCDQTSAAKLANSNSRDNNSSAVVTPNTAQREVLVQTATRVGASTILPYSFGRLLTNVPKTVHASATAAWGYAATAVAIPLAISPCDKQQLTIGTFAVINLGSGFGPCPGRDTSGAFGWLNQPCQTAMSAVAGAPLALGSSGKAGPMGCLQALKGTVIALPIYDIVTGTGSNAKYHIIGFAALRLAGWDFPGDASTPPPVCAATPCITGTFANLVTTSTVLGGADFGVFRVFLSK